ncbi:MAG: helix-turn-helix transcriptional regulator [Clostridia bacterium]|nr:helix-turn-helix transcriptional regulator [Clostridia bacterium]
MLLHDFRRIGNKLYSIRKRYGMTQLETAAAAEISEKTYADLERGKLNIRLDTLLRICEALHITPDEILTDDSTQALLREETILSRLQDSTPQHKETALRLLETYLKSLE